MVCTRTDKFYTNKSVLEKKKKLYKVQPLALSALVVALKTPMFEEPWTQFGRPYVAAYYNT